MKPVGPADEQKTPGSEIVDRWVDRQPGDGEAAEFGALLRSAMRPEPLGPGQLAAVAARLTGPPARPWVPRWAWQMAIVFLVLIGGGALVAAKMDLLRRLPGVFAPHKESVAPDRPAPVRHRPPAASAPPNAAAPVIESPEPPAGRETKVAIVGHASRTARGMSPTPPETASTAPTVPPPSAFAEDSTPGEGPAPSPSELAQESGLLSAAIHKLRTENDPKGALALLDEHRVRYATGALAVEEKLTRVDALLQLGRRADALALLEPLRAPWTGRRRDLLVTRAELRSEIGRCAEALVDFGTLVSEGTHGSRDATFERALYGRASCRARRGERAGARADLERYLATYPNGRFAADARAALRGDSP
jgi:hypothetical protein